MRMPPLPADSIHARACKLKCEKILTRPFPLAELAVALGHSTQTCKRSFRELEDDGLILRVRWEIGAPNRIYVLVPKKRD